MRKKRAFFLSKFLFLCLVFIISTSLYYTCSYSSAPDTPSAYKRDDYRHWIDEDGDGIDTRNEVLIAESLNPVVMSENGRRVVSGLWVDPYTGHTNTDPRELDIDHMVPLQNAHVSGAWKWDKSKRQAYANSLRNSNHLIAVSRSANRQKGAKPPHLWLPANEAYQCSYIRSWMEIKGEWGLEEDPQTLRMWSNCVGSGAPHGHAQSF